LTTERFLYDRAQLAALRFLWSSILKTGSGVGAVIAEARVPSRVLHFTFAAFVTDERADGYHRLLKPKIAYSVAEELVAGGRPVLDANEIARANAGTGLNMVVTHYGHAALEGKPLERLRAAMYESTHKALSFWNLRSYTNEVFAENLHREDKEMGEALGYLVGRYTREQLDGAGILPENEPWLWYATRRHALDRPASMSVAMLFLNFTRPRLGLNAEEQRMLKLALDGRTDEAIAEIAGASLSTIRKRFRTIYEKVQVANARSEAIQIAVSADGARGTESRSNLLNYLRAYSGELRPYNDQR
jgi:DNA-binding CsgD family transcriptional regulator